MPRRFDAHRHRINTTMVDTQFFAHLVQGNFPFLYQKGLTHEEIHDVVGFPQLWNPAYHLKYKQNEGIRLEKSSFVLNTDTMPGHSRGDVVESVDKLEQYSMLRYIDENLPTPPSTLVDDLTVKAVLEFTKATNTETSLLNFIIELIQSLAEMIETIEKMVSIWSKMMALARAAYDRYIKEGKSHPESLWLAWNFAIKPTISDLKNLFFSLRNAKKRLAYLKRVNHTTTTKHFRRKNVWRPDMDVSIVDHHSFNIPGLGIRNDLDGTGTTKEWSFSIRPKSWTLDLNIQADVRFDIDDAYLEGGEGLGIVWSAMQGLYNPEAVLWEACPFSWLADYFVSQRQKLLHDLFDLSPLKDGVIQRACHSWKLRSTWDVILHTRTVHSLNYATVDETMTENKMGEATYDLYVRHDGLPQVEEVPLRIPGWNQLSNLFALLIQIGRGRRW